MDYVSERMNGPSSVLVHNKTKPKKKDDNCEIVNTYRTDTRHKIRREIVRWFACFQFPSIIKPVARYPNGKKLPPFSDDSFTWLVRTKNGNKTTNLCNLAVILHGFARVPFADESFYAFRSRFRRPANGDEYRTSRSCFGFGLRSIFVKKKTFVGTYVIRKVRERLRRWAASKTKMADLVSFFISILFISFFKVRPSTRKGWQTSRRSPIFI